jgi:hypothetical protein
VSNPFLALDDSSSITIQGVQCWDEGVTEGLSSIEPSATRTLVCAWADRLGLLAALGGGYNPTTGQFDPPQSYPLYPWLWVTGVAVAGIPGPAGLTNDTVNGQQVVGYQWARLRLKYTRLPINPLNITQGDLKIDFSDELTVHSNDKPLLQYASRGTVVPASITPPIRVARASFTLTRYNLSGLPLSILNLKSCVNASTFDFSLASCSPLPIGLSNLLPGSPGIAGTACPPGTLLMNNISTDKPITLGGSDQITASFDLQYRACGWNSLWNPDTSQFELVLTITPGTTPPALLAVSVLPNIAQGCVYPSGAAPPGGGSTTPGGQPMYPPADFSPLYGLL